MTNHQKMASIDYGLTLPEARTLYIYMTRGERNVRKDLASAFGAVNRVVIDVDGERHEYDADELIALLEKLEACDE